MRITNLHSKTLEFVTGVKDGAAVLEAIKPGETKSVSAKGDVMVEAYRNAGLITVDSAPAHRGKEPSNS